MRGVALVACSWCALLSCATPRSERDVSRLRFDEALIADGNGHSDDNTLTILRTAKTDRTRFKRTYDAPSLARLFLRARTQLALSFCKSAR